MIEAAGPVHEVVAPGLGLHWQALQSHVSHVREAQANLELETENLELETANFLDLNRRSPTSLMF